MCPGDITVMVNINKTYFLSLGDSQSDNDGKSVLEKVCLEEGTVATALGRLPRGGDN